MEATASGAYALAASNRRGVRLGAFAAHLGGMDTPTKALTAREVALTAEDRALLMSYCSDRPQRIIAMHEGVSVQGQQSPIVEIVYLSASGIVHTERLRAESAQQVLQAARTRFLSECRQPTSGQTVALKR
jgi:hypothetical protein